MTFKGYALTRRSKKGDLYIRSFRLKHWFPVKDMNPKGWMDIIEVNEKILKREYDYFKELDPETTDIQEFDITINEVKKGE